MVYKLQEEKYPNYNTFIREINNSYAYFGEIKTQSNKYNICQRQIDYKIQKKKKEDHMIFLTTPFQLNLFKESDILFMDGTFRSCPKSYYQVFNIIGHLKLKNISIPIMSVIMKHKYEICYINLFENLKIMLYENHIDIDFSKIYLMTDFERAIRNMLKNVFQIALFWGVIFII